MLCIVIALRVKKIVQIIFENSCLMLKCINNVSIVYGVNFYMRAKRHVSRPFDR